MYCPVESLDTDPPKGHGSHLERLFGPIRKHEHYDKMLDVLAFKIPCLRGREIRGCIFAFKLRIGDELIRDPDGYTKYPDYMDVWIRLFSPTRSKDITSTKVDEKTWSWKYNVSLVKDEEWMTEEFLIQEDDPSYEILKQCIFHIVGMRTLASLE
jgi:hypothetical protein